MKSGTDKKKRRSVKNNLDEYGMLNNIIWKFCREAKEMYWIGKCTVIADYQNKPDLFNVHKMVKEVTGTYRKRNIGILLGLNARLVIGTEDKR